MKEDSLNELSAHIEGELHWDALSRSIYATDASVYRKIPLAVAFPKGERDIAMILDFCRRHQVGLIPRAAGTSLAGQCVGEGIVLDVSRHLRRIVQYDSSRGLVSVQPGVVRDDLNRYLEPYGRFFGPNTSTANRCMIGGMVGNNSSGTTSIKYGVTRDKVHSIRMLTASGEIVECSPISETEWNRRVSMEGEEGRLLTGLWELLSPHEVQSEIRNEFPDRGIHRRNTGYALDELIEMFPFRSDSDSDFNLCSLLTGSEGTLGVVTEVTLKTDPLPPAFSALVTPHYHSIEDCLQDVVPMMQANLYTCEMMDKTILDCTQGNLEQRENRAFIKGDPKAILMLEVRGETEQELGSEVEKLLKIVQESGRSYAHPVLKGAEVDRAFTLRKAGLGLLANIPGDAKAVACIEDTAVLLEDLAEFISDFTRIMESYGQEAVYYAHAGAGEIHLRPILNLKKSADVALFRKITSDVAELTRRYRGSFSGEHGDGIVRAEFIPKIIGDKNYELLRQVKGLFDPAGILNPGKIVDPYPMDKDLRYDPDRFEWVLDTFMDFTDTEGYLRAAEKCNGSGDCRKTIGSGGGMCPSYRATLDEKDSTRARANALREFITRSEDSNPFDHQELKEVLDLCVSCKACARECPSNVDMATLKSEFLYQYQLANGFDLRSTFFAYTTAINRIASHMAPLVNWSFKNRALSGLIRKALRISPQRSLPPVYRHAFANDLADIQSRFRPREAAPVVALYIDEFTRYMEEHLAKDAMELLIRLGFRVTLFFGESGRTFISNGFLKQARRCAIHNLTRLRDLRERGIPLVGLEPSAVLTFHDEYRRLCPGLWDRDTLRDVMLIEDFLVAQYEAGFVSQDQFTSEYREVKIHAHCHQKALASPKATFDALNIPENYKVTLLPTGCCGMAGSFGYESEHYEVSMKMGELGVLSAVKKMKPGQIIVANGTSCRHQISDGAGIQSMHPVSVLRRALVV